METIAIVVALVLVYFFFIAPRMGNSSFWKLVEKNPYESWLFFDEHPDWFVGSPPQISGYCGPYKVLNPFNQTRVNVYCTNLSIADKSQKEFIEKYK